MSRSLSDTVESRMTIPAPSGVAASPWIRKPENAAPLTSKAVTAASVSDAPLGSLNVAPRGTRLVTRTPVFN